VQRNFYKTNRMGIISLFNPSEYVTLREYRERRNECMKPCPNFNKELGICNICSCVIALKAELKNEHCAEKSIEYPNGRWKKLN